MPGGAPKGSQNAKKENRLFNSSLKRSIAQAKGSPDKLAKITDSLVKQAADGNLMAIKEVADRLDGKSHQSTDVKVDGDLTIVIPKF